MAQDLDFQGRLHKAIDQAIHEAVDEAKERIVKVAVEMFEKRSTAVSCSRNRCCS